VDARDVASLKRLALSWRAEVVIAAAAPAANAGAFTRLNQTQHLVSAAMEVSIAIKKAGHLRRLLVVDAATHAIPVEAVACTKPHTNGVANGSKAPTEPPHPGLLMANAAVSEHDLPVYVVRPADAIGVPPEYSTISAERCALSLEADRRNDPLVALALEHPVPQLILRLLRAELSTNGASAVGLGCGRLVHGSDIGQSLASLAVNQYAPVKYTAEDLLYERFTPFSGDQLTSMVHQAIRSNDVSKERPAKRAKTGPVSLEATIAEMVAFAREQEPKS